MATHSSVLAWRILGTGKSGGLPSMGSHRVGHNWNNLAAAVLFQGNLFILGKGLHSLLPAAKQAQEERPSWGGRSHGFFRQISSSFCVFPPFVGEGGGAGHPPRYSGWAGYEETLNWAKVETSSGLALLAPIPQREMRLIPLQPVERTKEMWNQSRGLAAREISGLPIPSPCPGSLAGVPLDLRLSGTRAWGGVASAQHLLTRASGSPSQSPWSRGERERK